MSCIIMGIVQCVSVVLADFIKNTPHIFGDKCLSNMQTVLYRYLNRKHELYVL